MVTAEVMWKVSLLRREAGRKYIHIMSGLWIASWPLFLSFRTITALSFVLLIGVLLTRHLHLGKSIHTIDRLSSGDILFPVGIGLSSLITDSGWVFCIAVLHIGLADGLAGLLGSYYNFGKYKIAGQSKSFLGTGIFIMASMAILTWAFNYGPAEFSSMSLPVVLATIPPLAAFAENISPLGIDNITVPMLTILLLNVLAS